MDVETFTNNVASAHNKCSTEIKENLVSIFAAEEQDIRQRLTEIIKGYFPAFQTWKISDLLDASFKSFKETQNAIGNQISEKVEIATKSAVRMSSKIPMERVSSAFSTLVHELLTDNALNQIEVPAAEMLSSINSYLKKNEAAELYTQEKETFDSLVRVNVSLDDYISNLVQKVKKSSQNILGEIFEGYVKDIISRIEEYLEKSALDITTKVNLATALRTAGYSIAVEEASLILTDIENNKKYELEKKEGNTYTTTDGSITIVEDTDIRFKNANSVLTIGDKTICVGTEENPYHMIISQDYENHFEVYYNTIQENDLVKTRLIIDTISVLWPGIIKSLEEYAGFRELRETAKTADESKNKFYKDENGIDRINETHKEELYEAAHILGFELTSDELGTYFEKSGEKHKIIYENDLVKFEDDPSITITLDLYILGKFELIGPMLKYTDSSRGITLIANEDLSHMSLHIRNNAYLMDYEDKAKYGMRKAGKKVESHPIIRGEVESVFEEYMPNALKRFNQKYVSPNIPRPAALHPLDEFELTDDKTVEQAKEPEVLVESNKITDLLAELARDQELQEEIEPDVQGNSLPTILDEDYQGQIVNLLDGDPSLVDEIGTSRLGM